MAVEKDAWGYPKPTQFHQGYNDFFTNGICPYKMGTPKAKEWERGYNKAYFENQKRYG